MSITQNHWEEDPSIFPFSTSCSEEMEDRIFREYCDGLDTLDDSQIKELHIRHTVWGAITRMKHLLGQKRFSLIEYVLLRQLAREVDSQYSDDKLMHHPTEILCRWLLGYGIHPGWIPIDPEKRKKVDWRENPEMQEYLRRQRIKAHEIECVNSDPKS